MARRLTAAAAIYAAAAVALFGRGVVPHPATAVVGDDGADKTLYMWAFEWWPWAIRHGHDPLDVNVAWAPHGFDLGLGTAGGGLALLATPLTLLAGPVVTYNVLALVAPTLAATTAFLLAHLVTRQFAPSLVSGFVFGFSSYELGHLLGHLPLAFTAAIPLVPYLVIRRHARTLGRTAFVVLLTAALAFEFLVVTQLFFTAVLVGGVAAAAAFLLYGRSVRKTVLESALAVCTAMAIASPFVVYAFVSHAAAPARSPFAESADVLNFVVPTRRTWLRPPGSAAIADRFTGTGAELGAYIGIPLLALAVLAFVRHRRDRSVELLAAVLAVTAALALGTRVKVAGTVIGIGPWDVLARLPLVGSALPVRLTVYTSLFFALLVAIALADRPGLLRWALAVVGVAAMLPNLALPTWHSSVPQPAFFAHGARALPRGSTALVLPYGAAGWSMLWQAETRFRFTLVGGHFALKVTPQERAWADVYDGLGTGRVTPARLRSFLAAHRVDEVLVARGARPGVLRLVRAARLGPARRALDVTVYDTRALTSARPARPTASTRRPATTERHGSVTTSARHASAPTTFSARGQRRCAASCVNADAFATA